MGHRLSKITTKTGDRGTTGLGDGSRVPKTHPRIAAIGDVDELNCVVGLLMTEALPDDIRAALAETQHELFDLGGELSIPGYTAIGDVQIARTGRSGRLLYSVGPRATFAGRDYVQTYFGVDEAQAQRTGLAVSRPDGGLVSYGLGGTLTRPLTRRSAVTALAGIDRLGGEPAGSALIRERGRRTQVSLGLAYGLQFGL